MNTIGAESRWYAVGLTVMKQEVIGSVSVNDAAASQDQEKSLLLVPDCWKGVIY